MVRGGTALLVQPVQDEAAATGAGVASCGTDSADRAMMAPSAMRDAEAMT